MTNIILPVNFSSEVRNVLIAFIKKIQTKTSSVNFVLLHAYDTPKYGFAMGHDITDILKENTIADLENEKNKILEEIPGVSIKIHAEQGSLVEVMNRYEKENPVDFAVVSLKGSNMLQSILVSNKPSLLASKSNIPVLFLPNAQELQLPTKIVFGTDVKPFENEEDFKGMIKIFKLLDTELHFLYVNEDDKSMHENFKAYYEKHLQGINYSYTEVEYKDAAKGILDFIKINLADGIALIERKGNFLKRLLNSSVLDDMITKVQLPIMVINECRES